jgi:hypothetical protein
VEGEGEGGREDGDRVRDRNQTLLVFFDGRRSFNIPNGFFLTYHGFLTIASSSRIISRDESAVLYHKRLKYLFTNHTTHEREGSMKDPAGPYNNYWKEKYLSHGFVEITSRTHAAASDFAAAFTPLTSWPPLDPVAVAADSRPRHRLLLRPAAGTAHTPGEDAADDVSSSRPEAASIDSARRHRQTRSPCRFCKS